MNEKEQKFFDAMIAYNEMFPEEAILSPDMLKEEYSNDEYIISVYQQCVREHKTIEEVVPDDHFIHYPPGVEI